jgi:hypothetical protein
MATMKINKMKTNLFFIVPIALWLAFYGIFLIKPSQFSSAFVVLMLLGGLPYGILWIIAARFPDNAGICKVGSIAIFTVTIAIALYFVFFEHNAERAMWGFLFIPVMIISLILCIVGLLPFAAVIVYIRRRLSRKREIEQQ